MSTNRAGARAGREDWLDKFTARDRFAMAAMTALLQCPTLVRSMLEDFEALLSGQDVDWRAANCRRKAMHETIARRAYIMADAMITARIGG